MRTKDETYSLPFLKWAGGKRWFVENHHKFFETTFNTYIEPFVGSGAVFFFLQPKKSILSDINSDLIDTYVAIKNDWHNVEKYLKVHQRNHSKEYYYTIRRKIFNSSSTRAAQFIYLNRTCWNGLYRVNLEGKFNVPIGSKDSVILESDDFEKTSLMLQNAKLISSNYDKTILRAKKGDFIFIDPPYTVKHNHNGFIKYNEGLFSWDDQILLRDSVKKSMDKGAKVLITNAYHPSVLELYKGIGEHFKVLRPSRIAANANARGIYEEIVVKCY